MNIQQIAKLCRTAEGTQAVENTMGMFCFMRSCGRYEDILSLWASGEDLLFEGPWGIYKGRAAVGACFSRDTAQYDEKGVSCRHLNSQVIEIADDGNTARGIWISPGHEYADGPYWAWNRFAVDFIREEDEWKIWKMRLYPTWRCPYDTQWSEVEQTAYRDRPAAHITQAGRECWVWNRDTTPADEPAVIEPYDTYDSIGWQL